MSNFETAKEEFAKAFGEVAETSEDPFDFGEPEITEQPASERVESDNPVDEPAPEVEPQPWEIALERSNAEIAALRAQLSQQRPAPEPAPRPVQQAPPRNPIDELYVQDQSGQWALNPQALQASLGMLAHNQKQFHEVAQQTMQMRNALEVQQATAAYEGIKAKYPDLEKFVTRDNLKQVLDSAVQKGQYGQTWDRHIENAYFIAAGPTLRKAQDEVAVKREAAKNRVQRTAGAISPGGASYQAPAPTAAKRGGSMKDAQKAFRQEFFAG